MNIQIVGTGCPDCDALLRNTQTALQSLGLQAQPQKVEDLREMVLLGVMTVPALLVDGRCLVAGRVPSPQEIASLLTA